jgi:NAD(P)H-hydrate epimerase
MEHYMAATADQLAQLFRETGQAHHEAFRATDGADPEWPLWYADQLLKPLSDMTGFAFTRSELVYVLLLMSKEQPVKAPGADWATYYAQYVLEHYHP